MGREPKFETSVVNAKGNGGMGVQTYVSTGDERSFTPLLDVALDFVSRDSRWRRALADQIAPNSRDVILDMGCGDGALALALAAAAPGAVITGLDPDVFAVERARLRATGAGLSVSFVHGPWRDGAQLGFNSLPTKAIVNFTGAVSSVDKREMLETAHAAMRAGGRLHVAAVSRRAGALFQRLLRSAAEGEDAGATLAAIRAAGFEAVEETARIPTASGLISLYRARAA